MSSPSTGSPRSEDSGVSIASQRLTDYQEAKTLIFGEKSGPRTVTFLGKFGQDFKGQNGKGPQAFAWVALALAVIGVATMLSAAASVAPLAIFAGVIAGVTLIAYPIYVKAKAASYNTAEKTSFQERSMAETAFDGAASAAAKAVQ